MGCGASKPVRVGKACLASHDADKGKRAEELAARKKEYHFEILYPGLPPLMKEPPKNEQYKEQAKQEMHFKTAVVEAMGDMAYSELSNMFDRDDDGFDKWRHLLSQKNMVGDGLPFIAQEPANRWMTDAEFGWQKMNGQCPMHFARCTALPKGFAVTDAVLEGVLPAGVALKDIMKAGRVFLSDYSLLEDPSLEIPAKVCGASGWVLLWSDNDKQLMPLAIQLLNDPAKSPVFTPKDGNTWLAAKMHAQAAEHNWDTIYHVMNCHLLGESIYDAMQRNLHFNHPIHVLLVEHFFFTVGINVNVKGHVLAGNDPSDCFFTVGGKREAFMALCNKAWDFNASHNMPEQMKIRGIDSKEVLPGNLWRDDTLAIWDKVEKYVGKVLGFFYKTDEDVAKDAELASWVAELTAPRRANVGMVPANSGCGFVGMPVGGDGKMTTVAQAVLLVTEILFNQTVNHSAGGGAGYQMTAFAPNMPGQFHLPIADLKAAKEKGEEVAMGAITKALPGLAAVGIAVMSTKDSASAREFALPCYSADFFKAEQVKTHLDTFTRDMAAVGDAIEARNAALEKANNGRGGQRPYRFLTPSQIGMSVCV
jgi:arachidonate 5-lipoxygenase